VAHGTWRAPAGLREGAAVKYDVVLAPSVRTWMTRLELEQRVELLLAIRSELKWNDPRTRDVPGLPGRFVREVLAYHVRYRKLKELERKRYDLSAGYMVLDVSEIDGFPFRRDRDG
jgi:hypothetical protein